MAGTCVAMLGARGRLWAPAWVPVRATVGVARGHGEIGVEMPSYVCTTIVDRLTGEQRRRIARLLTDAHHDTTGAPAYFVRVEFREVDPTRVFVGGAPLDHDHLFVFGHIRAGRDEATRGRLIERISAGVRDAAELHHLGVWIYLCELAPENMVEFGYVLPPDGQEAAWRGALPDDDRRWMDALGV
jgi:phenylpyruvate tautomerase PptA (4-oxalocrotonate tautomerase family)